VSGAQEPAAFAQVLEQVWTERDAQVELEEASA
jgi:predicted DsbA family dithiol-disulfide isomerase